MARIPVSVLLTALLAAPGIAADSPESASSYPAPGKAADATTAPGRIAPSPPPAVAAPPALPQPPGVAPRWLDDVRAQRHALQEMRRAHQDARKDKFLRRRQEIREMMQTDRRLFRNHGPWLDPIPPAHLPSALDHDDRGMAGVADEPPAEQPAPYPPAGWDNGWYYNGW
jgi:hypothetical protein